MSVQSMEALERANAVRFGRSRIKRRIFAGELTASEVLTDTPPECATMSLMELLTAQNRWGSVRAQKFCWREHVWPNKALNRLTDRQRQRLADLLS